MDTAGARHLHWRIEQQRNWRQADAVQTGRQSATDPDVETLEQFRDDFRLYASHPTRDNATWLCKRLVDGTWQLGSTEEDPHGHSGGNITESHASADYSHVA